MRSEASFRQRRANFHYLSSAPSSKLIPNFQEYTSMDTNIYILDVNYYLIPMCIYVREITNEEGQKLQRLLRRSKDPVEMRRAAVVLQSAQGFRVREIAKSQFYCEKQVRTIIKRFNEEGFVSLRSKYGGGRPPTFDRETRLDIVDAAMSRPEDVGLPFTQWSLTKLRAYLIKKGVIDTISIERLRQILKEEGFSYQRSKTWKESTDPNFEAKKNK